MNKLTIGDTVKVSLIIREDWMSPMSFSGGIVTKINGNYVNILADWNKCTKHSYNFSGSGCYHTNAYLIEKL